MSVGALTLVSMTQITDPDLCQLSIVGHVVARDTNFPRGEVRISNGVVTDVLPEVSNRPSDERIDVGAAYVLPGVIDPHVHALSDPSEGVEAASRCPVILDRTAIGSLASPSGAATCVTSPPASHQTNGTRRERGLAKSR